MLEECTLDVNPLDVAEEWDSEYEEKETWLLEDEPSALAEDALVVEDSKLLVKDAAESLPNRTETITTLTLIASEGSISVISLKSELL